MERVEMPMVRVLAAMEEAGMAVDPAAFNRQMYDTFPCHLPFVKLSLRLKINKKVGTYDIPRSCFSSLVNFLPSSLGGGWKN